MTMKRSCTILRCVVLLFCALSLSEALTAQDQTWFKDVTTALRMDSVRSGQISTADFNGDGFPDLFFTNLSYNRSMKSRLWLNLHNPDSANPAARIYVDVTDSCGMYENRDSNIKGRIADTWGIADFNNDGYPDLISGIFYFNVSTFTDLGDRVEVLLNDGTGHFHLVKENGIEEIGDLYSEPIGKFPATSFCFLDYNLDGIIDIYVGTFSADHQHDVWLPGYLLKGEGDGTFTNVTDISNIATVQEPTYGATVCDWNNDGYPDIMTSPYCRTEGTLWKNKGDGTFENVTTDIGYTSKNNMHGNVDLAPKGSATSWFPRELCQWEALPCDYDNDGDLDIAQMLVHGGLDPQEGHSPLTINAGAAGGYKLSWDLKAFDRPLINGTIARRDTVKNDTTWSNDYGSFSLDKGSIVWVSNYGHLGDQAGAWFDMDNDGLQDFLLSATGYDQTNDRCYIQHQNPDHSFTEVALKLGLRTTLHETHSMRPLDFDLDGDDDFVIEYAPRTANAKSGRVWMLRNDVGNTNNHSSVVLRTPAGCNKSAIGARIYVYSGGTVQMRELASGIGRWGMSQQLMQNFGLAKNESIDSIVVRWPMKGLPTTTVVSPPINKTLYISKEGLVNGVADNDAPAKLDIEPNPAHDRLRIHIPAELRGGAILEVYSMQSQRLLQLQLGDEAITSLPVNTFNNGAYFLRVQRGERFYSSSFVIAR